MKKALLSLVLAVGLASSSCLGPDPMYNGIKNWNADLTEKDWLNEIVFLGLTIIPVYPIALLGDVLVVNTIGYWSGNYLFEPGEFPGFSRKEGEM